MLLHSRYTDYKTIYKIDYKERLEHITDFNKIIEINYYGSGKIQEDIWFVNGLHHREDGPAIIKYYESGQIKTETWYLNSRIYRENGPAYIVYDESGNITNQQFFLNNIEYTYDDFIQTPEYQAYLKRKSVNIFD